MLRQDNSIIQSGFLNIEMRNLKYTNTWISLGNWFGGFIWAPPISTIVDIFGLGVDKLEWSFTNTRDIDFSRSCTDGNDSTFSANQIKITSHAHFLEIHLFPPIVIIKIKSYFQDL